MIWHEYDNNGWLINAKFCNEKPGDNWTYEPVTENWKRPRWNFQTQEWYNGATEDEQIEHEAKCKAMATAGDHSAINYDFTEPQTSDTLNEIYGNVMINYNVLCPNIEGGKEYTKISETQWRVVDAKTV